MIKMTLKDWKFPSPLQTPEVRPEIALYLRRRKPAHTHGKVTNSSAVLSAVEHIKNSTLPDRLLWNKQEN